MSSMVRVHTYVCIYASDTSGVDMPCMCIASFLLNLAPMSTCLELTMAIMMRGSCAQAHAHLCTMHCRSTWYRCTWTLLGNPRGTSRLAENIRWGKIQKGEHETSSSQRRRPRGADKHSTSFFLSTPERDLLRRRVALQFLQESELQKTNTKRRAALHAKASTIRANDSDDRTRRWPRRCDCRLANTACEHRRGPVRPDYM